MLAGSSAATARRRTAPSLVAVTFLLTVGVLTPPAATAAQAQGTITGTVTDETGAPAEGVLVRPWTAGSSHPATRTASDGTYSLTVNADSYRVEFVDDIQGRYVREYWDDKPSFATADWVAVAAGATVAGIDASLALAGAITGRVTVAEGSVDLRTLRVSLSRADSGDTLNTAYPAADGTYTLHAITSGDYKVYFWDPAYVYVPEYYDDRRDFNSATVITVAAPQTVTGIDGVLSLAHSISGTVTTGAGGRSGVQVSAWEATSGERIDWTSTATGGSYTLDRLPGGQYKVWFRESGFASEWWDDQPDMPSADVIVLSGGVNATGINALLAPGGDIAGTVTDGAGGGIAGIEVSIYDLQGRLRDWAVTGADGTYRAPGFPAGDYKVEFTDPAGVYLTEWWNDQPDSDSANLVAVTGGQLTRGIDAVLTPAATITGTVTAAAGPLADIEVNAIDEFGVGAGGAVTGADGSYTVTGLVAGSYRVRFSDPALTYASEWYDDVSAQSLATPVTLSAGQTVTGIDAVLQRAGSIAGKVRDDSAALANIQVTATDPFVRGAGVRLSTTTTADGSYLVRGLPAGRYLVSFVDPGDVYLDEWFDDGSLDQADLVEVVAGATTSGIDAVLARGGQITGTVSGSGSPLAGIAVDAHDAVSEEFVAFASTAADGSYTLRGLRSGEYLVRFRDFSVAAYAPQWWNGEPLVGSALPVTVTEGVTTPGIDAVLRRGGNITGTVNGGGGPLEGINVIAQERTRSLFGDPLAAHGFATTGDDGSYQLSHLPEGTYAVRFEDPTGAYAEEWWNDAPFAGTAATVTVTDGATTPAINADLAPAGSISGFVTDATTGQAISCFGAVVYDTDLNPVGAVEEVTGGAYTVAGLPAGDYLVRFTACSAGLPDPFLREWYSGARTSETATPVAVPAGTDVTGIDALITPGQWVVGFLSDAVTRAPLTGICVSAHDESSGSLTGFGWSHIGFYQLGLWPGQHRVHFRDCRTASHYASEWFDDQPSFAAATPLAVGSHGELTGIDAALAAGGAISGVVTDGFFGVAGISVEVLDRAAWAVNDSTTAADGSYRVGGLPTGTYKVRFSHGAGAYAEEWFDDQATFAAADPVVVTAPQTTSKINAELTLLRCSSGGYPITGLVTDESTGAILNRVTSVSISHADGTPYDNEGTRPDGIYVACVPPGEWKVSFFADDYLVEFWDNKPNLGSADVIAVVDSRVAGIDAALTPNVHRLWGPDRFATAAAISKDSYPAGASLVYVANGLNFPDALAGGPAAAQARAPLLLVTRDAIPPPTAAEILRLGATEVVILGGTGVVSQTVAEQLADTFDVTVRRLWGLDRFATAAAISKDSYPAGATLVYVANGLNFPDALAGGPAAAQAGAPLLLVLPDALPEATADELKRLRPEQIRILGGSGVVSEQVAKELTSYASSVDRLWGPDRFATAAVIAEDTFPLGANTVYVAYGLNFPDALAGGPAAAQAGAPLLLVTTDAIPQPTATEIRRLGAVEVVILGGTGVVSAGVRDQLIVLRCPLTGGCLP